MRTSSGALAGFAAGSAAMFFLDPQQGRRRRALARDQWASARRSLEHDAGVMLRDFRQRLSGVSAELRAIARNEQPSDEVLAERVRARLGRVCSHPHAVEVLARDGCVELKGAILASEQLRVVASVRRVRGVRQLDDDLIAYESAEHVPALQGGRARGRRLSPTARLAAASLGLSLAAAGLKSRRLGPLLLGGVGLALLSRSASGQALPELRRVQQWGERWLGRAQGFGHEPPTQPGSPPREEPLS